MKKQDHPVSVTLCGFFLCAVFSANCNVPAVLRQLPSLETHNFRLQSTLKVI